MANIDDLTRTHWPRSLADRLDRALMNLGKMSEFFGMEIEVTECEDALLYARHKTEMQAILEALEKGLLIEQQKSLISLKKVRVRAEGWRRIGELERATERERSKRVFVAMWFHESVAPAFVEGLVPAIKDDCGFEPRRIDLKQFNEDVMAEILAEIRASRFLVADLTGHRLGVYFEAGFAKGLGIPVIFSCHKDATKDAHFDVNHFNFVEWTDPPELRKMKYSPLAGQYSRSIKTDFAPCQSAFFSAAGI